MIFQIGVLILLASPIIYLIVWGLLNHKIDQYRQNLKEVVNRWKRKKAEAIKRMRSKKDNRDSSSISLTEGRIQRRSSIDRFLPPPGEPRDCVV